MVFVSLFIAQKHDEKDKNRFEADNLAKFIVVVLSTILTLFCLVCMMMVVCRCLNKWILSNTRAVYA